MKAELLSPSGSWECVEAAVCNGADAVYLGGKLFNARAYASNFSLEELEKVCDYCHSYQTKVYVTVNTLYKDSEFEELLPFIGELHDMGVDGLIMQDIGAISLVRELWPDMPVHASTQLTANSLEDVKEMEQMGLSTVVLSRELNLEEINEITHNTTMKVEAFIHGALCVSYSGQCLISSVLGKRSGNRGKCAQNCRLNYELIKNGQPVAEGHLLSTKDICTLDILPQLLDSGVASLKIEGRMKSTEYVAGVTSIYRKYIDMYYENREGYHVDEEDRELLKQLFNRGGFSQGYFKTHSGLDMMCPVHPRNWGVEIGTVTRYKNGQVTIKLDKPLDNGDGIEIWTEDEEGVGCYINKPCHLGLNTLALKGNIQVGAKVYQTNDKKLNDRLAASIGRPSGKRKVSGFVSLKTDEPAQLTLTCGSQRVTVEGDMVQHAEKHPLSEEFVREQLSRMGETVFELDKLKIVCDSDSYVNRSVLNDLKNRACQQLQAQIIASYKRTPASFTLPEIRIEEAEEQTVAVSVSTAEQFEAVLQQPEVRTIYVPAADRFDDHIDEMIRQAHSCNKELIMKLPRIWRHYVYENIDLTKYDRADGWLISCLGHLHSVKGFNKKLYLEHTGNVINRYSYDFWKRRGVQRIAMSIEASREEMISDSDVEVLAYGQLPLMVTHQCPIGNFAGYKKNHQYCREVNNTDRYELKQGPNRFILKPDCTNCICTILSAQPLHEFSAARAAGCGTIRFHLEKETATDVNRLFEEYRHEGGKDNGYYDKGIE